MTANVYDAVPYPSAVYQQTHPDRLAVMATLYGVEPPPVERCRVLELGCGDGWNLISMAYGLPRSTFTGIDLASQPIERGVELARKLGLRNLDLRQMDVADAPDLGEFDYIIAHGLYSWVPEAVRAKVMELCGRSLSKNGVAYISYNAYPGNHLRDMVRGMMKFHTENFSGAAEKVQQAKALLKFIADSKEPRDLYHHVLADELERLKDYSDGGIFHDHLSETNQPFYFHEFMAHADGHGLQFLAEADMSDNHVRRYPPKVEAAIAALDPDNVVGREQYFDFLRCRQFRQTLLCRKEHAVQRDELEERAIRLRVAGEIRSERPNVDLRSSDPEIFRGRKDTKIEINHPVLKAAFAHLGAIWPECIAFQDLLEHATGASETTGAEEKEQAAETLAAALVQAQDVSVLEFRAHRPSLVSQPGTHPECSALARLQLQLGNRATILLHTVAQIDDPLERALAPLLDGSRDRAMLQADLANLPAGVVSDPITDETLEAALHRLARRALLVS
ncbi:MAG TPA: class I SAM-dependent methyltransferase [Chthoniobacter sp.]|nr:class I SAM-dependent methyltransferase [Chthoniobacter sp.]